MGLRVWLPLNGSLENQGLSNVSFSNIDATVNTSGKIGSCYSFNGTSSRIYANNVNLSNAEMSGCCWVKFNNLTSADYPYIFSLGSNVTGPNMQIGLSVWKSDTKIHIVGNGSEPSSGYTPPLNTWIHLCITISGATTKLYVNGTLTSTQTNANTPKTQTCLCIGARPNSTSGAGTAFSYPMSGYINDFRLYDHALSVKEVEELARGLVVHYKLNNNGLGSPNLALNSRALNLNIAKTNLNIGKYSGATIQSYNNTFAKIVCTANWHGVGMYLNQLNLTAGQKLTFSFYAYTNGNSKNISFYPMMFNSGGTRDTSSTLPISINGNAYTTANSRLIKTLIATTPEYNYVTFEWSSTTKSIIDNGGYIILTIQAHGTWNAGDEVYLFAPKLEFGDVPSNWSPAVSESGVSSTSIIDCSGYKYHATVLNNISTVSDTPRYTASTRFDGTNAKIQLPTITYLNFGNSYTFSWWQYNIGTNNMAWGFSNGNRLNVFQYTPVCWNTGDGASNPFKDGSTQIVPADLLNAWRHVVVTGDGTETKLYIDGVYRGKATTYKALTGTQIYISGWDTGTNYTFNGSSLSDFRIYSTTLTAKQVLELYNESGAIDRDGNVYAREVNEL